MKQMQTLIFQFHAMNAIHKNGYDVAKAIACFIPEEGPILCRDEMEEWSSGKFQGTNK